MNDDIMRIDGFTIYTVRIPMRIAVSHTLADRKVATNILVCARGCNGLIGWGESCPRPYVTGETIDTVRTNLAEDILPPMIGSSFSTIDELTHALESMLDDTPRNRQAAFCAAELAVLDLAGKTFNSSVGSLIGPLARSRVRYTGVIASSDPAKVRKYARLMKLFGFRDVKLKVRSSLDENLRLLEIARNILPPKISLRIDANCAWSADEALRQLEAMSRFELAAVEQPVAADDYRGLKQVTAAGIVPVVADESLCSTDDARRLAQEKACDIFNIRVSKCGGLLNSLRIYRHAVSAGLACQLGAQVGETAILSAAGRHLATRCPHIKWCEGSYGKFLLKRDIARPDITIGLGGWARTLKRTGLGIEPLAKRINEFRTDLFEVT